MHGRACKSVRGLAASVVAVAVVLPLLQPGPGGGVGALAPGLNVVVGFAGLLDLGSWRASRSARRRRALRQPAFWGLHFSFLVILVLAVVATTAAGLLIGLPTLRLRGDYIGIVTLAFGEIIGQIVSNGRDIEFLGGSLTGGPNGMSAIDRIDLPFLERFGVLDLRPWYWFALALVGLVLVVNVRLRDSRMGRAWVALRDDEAVAACAGVPIVRTKLLAYGVGAALGGVSGAFLASYLSFVNPHQFTFSFSIFILAMVVLGGLGSIWGVVVGAVVLSVINNHLLPRVLYDLPGRVGLDFDLSEISSGIYGLLLVLLMLVRPQGLIPARRGAQPAKAQSGSNA